MTTQCNISGVIFLDKPIGWSSRRAVNEVVRQLTPNGMKRIKAGHGGTLDPLATGMLPILVGEATRFAELGLSAEKCYRVSFDLSYQTDTLDCEGEVTARHEPAELSEAALQACVSGFIGEIQQVPPQYSAIRIDGKRAHELARKGEAPEMKARAVTIHTIDIEAFSYPLVTLNVHCSKGTYIRSLARDIGAALGLGGCVTMLRRISTGGWPEAVMVSLDAFTAAPEASLVPLAQWLRGLERQALTADQAARFVQGQRLQLVTTDCQQPERDVAVFADDMLLGTATLKQGLKHMVLHPLRILPSAQALFR